ncbi:DUF6538 domain-containing protein [Anianabacter salinae]|uniref:DUF6538 domain-containing protein n=1 Tax=Anianabacter salinae TaxID=2851023 RepID=UPI00225E6B94|nr:DUF6538 domain-containing protein [Anianabacter salinae]MBV0912535.1 hypothetical protein [Anianabacter salinae]
MPQPVRVGSTYYLRIHVPSDVAEKARGMRVSVPVGDSYKEIKLKSHAKVSLQTKQWAEARRRFSAALEALDGLWDVLRNELTQLTHKQAVALAGEARNTFIDLLDEEPGSASLWEDVAEADLAARQGRLNALAIPNDTTLAIDLERRFGGLANAVLRRRGLVVDAGSRARLVTQLSQAMQDVPSVNRRKALGDYTEDGKAKAFPSFESSKPEPPDGGGCGWTFKGVIADEVEARAAGREAKPMPKATRAKFERLAKEFSKHRQSDRADNVTAKEVDSWKRSMLSSGELSNNTIRQRLQNLSALLEWVRKQSLGELYTTGNPVAVVPIPEAAAASSEDRTLRMSEARAILRAAREEAKPTLRWVPWMCAFSGARINEVAPLEPDDFFRYEGAWYYNISTMGGRSLKNVHSIRTVPVHPQLEAEGLIQFVQQVKAEGGRKLFLARSQNTVATWVREEVGLTRKELAPSHGWRHLFEDMAMRSGMSDSAKTYITGRSLGKSAERYGKSEVMLPGLARELTKIPSYLPDE